MKKFFNNQCLRTVLSAAALVSVTLFFVSPLSCRLTEEGVEILPVDTVAPSVDSFLVTGANTVRIVCSEKIVFEEITVTDDEDGELCAVADSVTYSEDGTSADIEFSSLTTVGKDYSFSALVVDRTGNSLEFSQRFSGYNENPALLMLNEVRVNNSAAKQSGEFVEFVVLKSGNTSGLTFTSASYSNEILYEFPAMEVSQGEFITLHGRTFFTNSKTKDVTQIDDWENETEDDFALSAAVDSSDSARDLWIDGDGKIASKSSVLVLRNSATQKQMDALLLSEEGKKWTKKRMEELAEEAVGSGTWTDGSAPDCAFITADVKGGLNNSISRVNTAELLERYASAPAHIDHVESSASDWKIVLSRGSGKKAVPGTTPGFMNNLD